ncbi:universal stress protein UspA [Haloarcula taiwanensis]|uniref:Universal stress protein UspA n=1 Tax=Haloarcula taiwanensis TaxID=1932004 RepID=A0A2H5A3J1_9EURY|nr:MULTISPECIES: universal stress protein [Haloarcula]AUG49291.1 universal stress protein UspA [Haloarcula taiwanensis]RLM34654.1 universal stress protein [Haloarcula sp. Atlit-120R]RLM44067.1 universal stress protein [Haloarcula sp. Atlit-47R]RLM95019.1 universal stress protein [Haloarcula sp. Atlit-7R]
MYSDILVPTDGSASMKQVLEHTVDIADGRDVTVHALYVIDDRAFLSMADEMQDEVLENMRAEGEAATSAVRETLEQDGIEVSTAIQRGKPADRIVSYVADADIDLITMGTQADEYEKNMLGSTAQKVVTKSSVPVLTVDVSESE